MTVKDRAVPVLAVCGLEAEARIAATLASDIVVSGADPGRLARGLAGLDLGRFRFAVSFGLCGGLSPALAAGAVVVADTVVSETERFAADAGLCAALRAALPGAVGGAIAGVDRALTDPGTKANHFAATGAVAADMESHVLARVSAAAGLPFVALRAVSDAADRSLPPLALKAVDAYGRLAPIGILASLFRHPSQIVALPGLARDSRRAFSRLGEAAMLVAPLIRGFA